MNITLFRKIQTRTISNSNKTLDRWSQFDPERPPYRFGPERDKSTNTKMMWSTCFSFLVLSYFVLKLIEYRQHKMESEIIENPRSYMHAKMERNGLMVEQALIEHEIKVRREKLGLPARTSGIVEIQEEDHSDA